MLFQPPKIDGQQATHYTMIQPFGALRFNIEFRHESAVVPLGMRCFCLTPDTIPLPLNAAQGQ